MKTTTATLIILPLLAVIGFLIPYAVLAAPTGTTCSNAGCFVDATGDQRVSSGAATDSLEAEVCATIVTAGAGLTSSQYLSAAKSLYVENRSSATCYLSLDAATLTTTGSTGYKFAAGTERSFDVDGSIFGPLIRFACTATQTTGACLFFGWLK